MQPSPDPRAWGGDVDPIRELVVLEGPEARGRGGRHERRTHRGARGLSLACVHAARSVCLAACLPRAACHPGSLPSSGALWGILGPARGVGGCLSLPCARGRTATPVHATGLTCSAVHVTRC